MQAGYANPPAAIRGDADYRGTRRFDFVAREGKLCKINLVRMQAAHGRRADDPPRLDVACPMHAADDTALPERESAGKDGDGAIRRHFRKCERPGPADGRMPGRIGIGAPALVMILRLVVGTARIHAYAPQEHVEVWRGLRGNFHVKRAGEDFDGLWEEQVRVPGGKRPARSLRVAL